MKKCLKNKAFIISIIVLFALVSIIQVGSAADLVKEPVKVSESITSKLSDELNKKISESDNDDMIPVSIWISDIDYKKVEQSIKKVSLLSTKYDEDEIESTIKIVRNLAKIEHETNNSAFYAELGDVEPIHIDKYAPNLIVNVKKEEILELSKKDNVKKMDLFVNEKKVPETSFSIPASNIDYAKNQGLSGNGVNVGILEYTDDSHCATVTNIITDIAPNANINTKYGHNKTEDYQALNDLINEGVSVINYSSGYPADAGTYSDFDEYIDYLVENYDITFVKSSGNGISSKYITNPGLAYNGITIGSMNENDTTTWSDDTYSNFSRYDEYSPVSKPDLSAPGENIYGDQSGTSFAAPHAVGLIALLMEKNPALKQYPEAVKATLAAGTFHTTTADYGDDIYAPYISDKEGAGVIDGKDSFRILNSGNLKQATLQNSQFSYQDTFYVYNFNKKVRVSLSWLKKDNISDLDISIFNNRNQRVGYSWSSTSNTEVLEFNPKYNRGTYRIVVDGWALNNTEENICIAWQQEE